MVNKRIQRRYEQRAVARALRAEVGRCEVCGHDPTRHTKQRGSRQGTLCFPWRLDVHEIARGQHRGKALDKRFAMLVLCYSCHMERVHGRPGWSEAKQLAVLKRSRPADYDLRAYNDLIGRGPRRITEAEVEVESDSK